MIFYVMQIVFLTTAILFADIAVTVDARKDLQITVYRDFGMVRDIRRVNLPEGLNRIRFEGVATGIKAESVNLEWRSGSGIELIGQSYEFDLVSPAKLMEKYVGREIEIVPQKDLWPDTGIQTAELISIHGEEPVFRIGTKITFGDIGKILFPYMPDNLYTRPTLLMNVMIPKRQETEIVASYLTEGVSWKASYILQVDKKEETASFGGWITFNNKSGLDWKNAALTFVAGDVRRVKDDNVSRPGDENDVTSLLDRSKGAYNFYSLKERVTVLSNHSNQVEWISNKQVKIKPFFIAEVDGSNQTDTSCATVYAAVEVENTASNGLGFSLPSGVMNIFKRDSNDNNSFIGESILCDTKAGRSFFAMLGASDNIILTRKTKSDGESYLLEIRNDRDKPITLKIRLNTAGRQLADSSEKYRIIRSSSLEWSIVVKSHDMERISYSFTKNVNKR